MKRKNRFKVFIVFIALNLLYFWNKNSKNQYEDELFNEQKQSSSSSFYRKRDLAFNQQNEDHDARKDDSQSLDRENNTYQNGPHNLSPQDPIYSQLKKYEIDPRQKIMVDYDSWFISNNFVQIHFSEYNESLGLIKTEHNNFNVIELNNKDSFNDYPPLVISYSTNQPVPLTGNIVVKFTQDTQMQETIDFLHNDPEVGALVNEVVVNQTLTDIRRLMVKPKKRGQCIQLYQKLQQTIGKFNIEAVNFDTHFQNKY